MVGVPNVYSTLHHDRKHVTSGSPRPTPPPVRAADVDYWLTIAGVTSLHHTVTDFLSKAESNLEVLQEEGYVGTRQMSSSPSFALIAAPWLNQVLPLRLQNLICTFYHIVYVDELTFFCKEEISFLYWG